MEFKLLMDNIKGTFTTLPSDFRSIDCIVPVSCLPYVFVVC